MSDLFSTNAIRICKIDDPASNREIDLQHMRSLVESLRELDQIHAIIVQESRQGRYDLLDGAYRVKALKKLKHKTIHAIVISKTASKDMARRIILEQRYIQLEKRWAIQAIELHELKRIYDRQYPETTKGKGKRGQSRDTESYPTFIAHMQKVSNKSKSNYSRLLRIANALSKDSLLKLDAAAIPQDVAKRIVRVPQKQHAACIAELIKLKDVGKHALKVSNALYQLDMKEKEKKFSNKHFTNNDAKFMNCTMQKAKIKKGSIDCAIVDCLYHGQHLDMYEAVGKRCLTDLKPDGFLAAYVGVTHLDKALSLLSKHLDYYALVTLSHKKSFGNVVNTKIGAQAKYIVIYRMKNSTASPHAKVPSIIEGSGVASQKHHIFEQGVEELFPIIEALTAPAQTIIDYCAGSGTTGVAALHLKRKVILIEPDAAHYRKCQIRVNEAMALRAGTMQRTATVKRAEAG